MSWSFFKWRADRLGSRRTYAISYSAPARWRMRYERPSYPSGMMTILSLVSTLKLSLPLQLNISMPEALMRRDDFVFHGNSWMKYAIQLVLELPLCWISTIPCHGTKQFQWHSRTPRKVRQRSRPNNQLDCTIFSFTWRGHVGDTGQSDTWDTISWSNAASSSPLTTKTTGRKCATTSVHPASFPCRQIGKKKSDSVLRDLLDSRVVFWQALVS